MKNKLGTPVRMLIARNLPEEGAVKFLLNSSYDRSRYCWRSFRRTIRAGGFLHDVRVWVIYRKHEEVVEEEEQDYRNDFDYPNEDEW